MNPKIEKSETVFEYSDPVETAGLQELWKAGDPLALVEAVVRCAKYGAPYPKWVYEIINSVMGDVYGAVFLSNGGKEIMRPDEEISARLQNSRDRLLKSFGLIFERDNPAKIRKRLLRNAFLAEEVARRCIFIPGSNPRFKGVNAAINELAIVLADRAENEDQKRKFPPEYIGVQDETIRRSWKAHRAKLTAFYKDNPKGPVAELEWFLDFEGSVTP